METWPSTLPQSVQLLYDIEPVNGLLSTTEFNNPTRNRTYSEWKGIFKMVVTSSQLSIFRTFYNDTLNQSGLFNAPWLTDLGFNFHVVRFWVDGPSWSSINVIDVWALNLPLEILPVIETDSDGYNPFPSEENGSESFAYQDTDGASLIWQDTDDASDRYLTV